MKTLLLIAQIAEFILILAFVFLYVLRTGRHRIGIILTWGLLAVFTFIMTAISLEWTNVSMTAGVAHIRLAEEENFMNVFPEGPHLLMILLFGWTFGVAVSNLALAKRERSHVRQKDSILPA